MNVQDFEWEEQLERLRPIMQPKRKHVALLLAHQYRRGRARNAAVERGLGQKVAAPMLSGPNLDLFVYYEMLAQEEKLETAAGDLLELLELRREEFNNLKAELEAGQNIDLDEKREILAQMMEKAEEMERLTGLMEQLSGAD